MKGEFSAFEVQTQDIFNAIKVKEKSFEPNKF